MRHRTPVALSIIAWTALTLCACDGGSGSGQKTAGHVESAVGSLTGDAKLKREGKKDEVVGGVKSAVGDLKDAAKDASK
ncbi:MAG: CsbD family protein [Caulobacteraceae bacterium]